jgi:hypothetical protein
MDYLVRSQQSKKLFGPTIDKPENIPLRIAAFQELIDDCPAALEIESVRDFLRAFEFFYDERIDAAVKHRPTRWLWSVETLESRLRHFLNANRSFEAKIGKTGATETIELTPLFHEAVESLRASEPEDAEPFQLQIARIYALITNTH